MNKLMQLSHHQAYLENGGGKYFWNSYIQFLWEMFCYCSTCSHDYTIAYYEWNVGADYMAKQCVF